MPMNRAFEPITIDKFKGMNTALRGSSAEQYTSEDDELVDLTNFNTTPDGFLEKRRGAVFHNAITSPSTPTKLRVLFLQRTRLGTLANRLYVTDGSELWRVIVGSGTYDRLLMGGVPIAGIQSMVEYGGTQPANAYSTYGVRWTTTSTPDTVGGVMAFTADNTTNFPWTFAANSPIGTQLILFKNRGWVINSLGGQNASGWETRLWYSVATDLGSWGGAGLGNNLNLDFGDGDYLTALYPYNDQLMVFKTRKTFVITADGDPGNWQTRLVADRVGCVGRGTVKSIEGVLYFLSAEGVIRTDGVTFQNISAPIRDYLDAYRNFIDPETTLHLDASYWDNKYILWMPPAPGNINIVTALVFNIPMESWTKWTLGGGVTMNGEAVWDEQYPPSILMGSGDSNRVWQIGASVWRDNNVNYTCSFTTKKYDLGRAMGRKRNHLVGVTVADNSIDQGTYTVTTTADDTVIQTRTEAPAKMSAMNLKTKGAGYGRYFQTKVDQTSQEYAAVYDITWMNEDRSFEPKSTPKRDT